MDWIGGHIDGFTRLKAKAAAYAAKSLSSDLQVSYSPSEASHITNRGLISVWQRRWDTYSSHSTTYLYMPTVCINTYKSTISRKAEIRLNRIILGHHRLKDRLHKIMPIAYPSAECHCGKDRQTTQHVMLHCSKHTNERDIMLNAVELAYHNHKVPFYKRKLSLQSLLIPTVAKEPASLIRSAVADFLSTIDEEF